VVVVEDATPQATQERAEEQPTAVNAAETAEEHPASERARAGTPTRDGEAARTPPPSNVVVEENRASTPPPAEEGRVPTPPEQGPLHQ